MTGNNALNVNTNFQNGKHVAIAITTHGSDWYWAVTALMTVCTFTFLGLGFMKPRSHRVFNYITASITLVAAIAYFSMASNLGWTPIDVEFPRPVGSQVHGINREIFYVRYIDWFITTPLLLLDLLLTAGMPWPTILYVILMDEVMIVTGLVGALVKSSYKWGYFAFGCAALGVILYELIFNARKHANILGKDVGRAFLICGALTSFLWVLYPVAWGVCEGGNVIPPDSEAAFYGVLDVFAKPVFGALLLWGHKGIEPSRLGLEIHDYTEDGDRLPGRSGEKNRNVNDHDGVGVSNGTHDNTATRDVESHGTSNVGGSGNNYTVTNPTQHETTHVSPHTTTSTTTHTSVNNATQQL